MSRLIRASAAAALATVLAASPAVADRGGSPNGGNGSDNPNTATPAAPAQPGTSAATPARPSARARRGAKAKRAHPAKPAKRAHPAKPAKGGPPKSKRPERGTTGSPGERAKSGKTTICHSTGSATKPYVEITVSDNALPAHRRHHDGRDIVPAPAGGCPGATSESTPARETGSETLGARGRGGEEPAAPGEAGRVEGSSTPGAGSVRGARAFRGVIAPAIEVLGAHASSGAAPAAASLPAARPTASRGVAGLPFTGLELGLIAALGLAALLSGTALRRSTRGRVLPH